MNKTALRNFATYARRKLRDDVALLASQVGINKEKTKEPIVNEKDLMAFDIGGNESYKITGKEVKYRDKLVKKLNSAINYEEAYEQLIEETAYTWFNRIIAIRFMEVNEYLPERVRVLSSGRENDHIPEIVTEIVNTEIFESFTESEKQEVINLKTSSTKDGEEELFKFLFFKVCHNLEEYLPYLFEKTEDYFELLFKPSFIEETGVIYKLINEIDESEFNISENGEIEIIGWLYQFYNEEYKSEVDAYVKKSKKVTKDDLPAKTQLFTPNWIVKYMVENSLGKLWIEGRDDKSLKKNWKYYLEEADQEEDVKKELEKLYEESRNLKPEDIKLIDPCMGSGHILIYAFDVFMEIYESQGYSKRDAAKSILENNIYGVDIDKRAFQLSYFSLLMKARQYNRRILRSEIKLNVTNTEEGNVIYNELIDFVADKNIEMKQNLEELKNAYIDAREYGSLIDSPKIDYSRLEERLKEILETEFDDLAYNQYKNEVKKYIIPVLKQAKILSSKYDVVITNPPYMGSKPMSGKLSNFVKENYPDSKSDLFATFIEKCNSLTDNDRYFSMITMHSWMFLSSYEKLREKLQLTDIVNMAHLGSRAFEEIGGEVVQTTSWVERKTNMLNYKATYVRLVDSSNAEEKETTYLSGGERYLAKKENFTKIPGMPIAYWASDNLINAFEIGTRMDKVVGPKQGLATADNNRFLRQWFEVNNNGIKYDTKDTEESKISGYKWVPYNKGGQRTQWYGNYDYVVNWENDGFEIRNFIDSKGKLRSRPQNTNVYFKEAITWGLITSGGFSIRYREQGGIHDVSGMSAFSNNSEKLKYVLGLMSTKIADHIFKMINPTINLQIGDFNIFPVLNSEENKNYIIDLSQQNINISKFDWDTFETSWDFKVNPLVNFSDYLDEYYNLLSEESVILERENYYINNIEDAYNHYKNFTNNQFEKLKKNEEELNRVFIDIYGLQDEMTPEVSDRDITIAKIFDNKSEIDEEIKGNKYVLTKEDVVKQFISYAVGCMFGRYSLDEEGLIYAGGDFNIEKYSKFIPDMDNCIPITDSKYFDDDIVTRFEDFVEKVYGSETLEENLNFVASSLGGKGESREVIRNYFIKDFYKDHVKKYQKRPIYWQYESGKQNGFKALVYMHRYDEYTTGKVRTEYLHKLQGYYSDRISLIEMDIANDNSLSNKKKSEDERIKIQKQLDECKKYDELIGHIAGEKIAIDLDDGVKVNYEKVQTDRNGKLLKILSKI